MPTSITQGKDMDAINKSAHPMDPFRDLSWRDALIGRQLQALNHLRKASAAVRQVLTVPIANRVEDDLRAIERIRKLTQLPLPEFKGKE